MNIEQEARNLLDRIGIKPVDNRSISSGDLGELGNLISDNCPNLNQFASEGHEAQVKAGWWTDIETGEVTHWMEKPDSPYLRPFDVN